MLVMPSMKRIAVASSKSNENSWMVFEREDEKKEDYSVQEVPAKALDKEYE